MSNGPCQANIAPSRRNETPTAPMSGAKRDLRRRGRKTTRSIPTFRNPRMSIVNSMTSSRIRITPSVKLLSFPTPNSPHKASEIKPPRVRRSPCAKLISSMIPNTIVYPMARSAQIEPSVIPITVVLTK